MRKKIVFKTISSKLYPSSTFLEKYRECVYLKEILDDLNIDCVLDVGANSGQFAQDLRLIGYTGKIISFEPVKNIFQELADNFKNDKNWIGFQIALGEEEKTEEILVPEDTKMSSFLSFEDKFQEKVSREKIEIKKLDDLAEELGLLNENLNIFLKMDTQGYDLNVFKGAKNTLWNIKGILSEISVKPFYKNMINYKDSLNYYENFGFTLCNLFFANRNDKKEVMELNCLMKKSVGNLSNSN